MTIAFEYVRGLRRAVLFTAVLASACSSLEVGPGDAAAMEQSSCDASWRNDPVSGSMHPSPPGSLPADVHPRHPSVHRSECEHAGAMRAERGVGE